MIVYFLILLDWLVIAWSVYLLSLMTEALLWGLAIGLMVVIGLWALLAAFSPPTSRE